ncbi:MAG: ABC transporter ATP-binding protein [Lactobacillales bacterium]|nr:ABC transporter ATP-binding protein [Lactobacillales bacterium]
MLEVKNLTTKLDGTTIIDDINFKIDTQEIIGLVGRNGSGKTTLFRTLANIYEADGGEYLVDSENPGKSPALREDIFYIDDSYNPLKSNTLKKNIELLDLIYLKFDAKSAFDLIEKTKLPLNKRFRSLSKGMKELFKIILAVSSNANYILLDEPFDGLDPIVKKNATKLILDRLAESGSSIIISSHNLSELEMIVSRVLILKDHTIARDYELDEVRSSSRKVQLAFETAELPAIITDNASHIERNGRIITATFESYNDNLKAEIQALNPLLFEELSVTLDDVFAQALQTDSDDFTV